MTTIETINCFIFIEFPAIMLLWSFVDFLREKGIYNKIWNAASMIGSAIFLYVALLLYQARAEGQHVELLLSSTPLYVTSGWLIFMFGVYCFIRRMD